MLPLVSSPETGLEKGKTSHGPTVAACTRMQKIQTRPVMAYWLMSGVSQSSFETSRTTVCSMPMARPE